MTQTAPTTIPLNRSQSVAGVGSTVQRELIGWAWLAVGALAVAGVFALLLALSRIPGMEKTPFWPIDFFYKGLVIHVVFSLVIWLQCIFAFLVSVATLKLAGNDVRAASLGWIGQGAVLVAFPFLFAPAFLEGTQPELTNYIPIIRHPAYDIGLLVLGLGVARAGRSSVDQSAGTACFRAAACGRDGAWRLRLCSRADLFWRRHDAARAERVSWPRARNCSGAAVTCCNSSTLRLW